MRVALALFQNMPHQHLSPLIFVLVACSAISAELANDADLSSFNTMDTDKDGKISQREIAKPVSMKRAKIFVAFPTFPSSH
jgi:Ca2+-binding EF-hand superfamily protein